MLLVLNILLLFLCPLAFPTLIALIHIFDPQFLFHSLYFNRIAHYLLHLLLCQLLLFHLELIQPLVVWFEMHEFVCYSCLLG